jgi:hypothetical protein
LKKQHEKQRNAVIEQRNAVIEQRNAVIEQSSAVPKIVKII